MATQTIEQLSEQILQICDENHVEYSSDMISNGFLLTDSSIKMLNRYKVRQIQITIDGDKDLHNKRRPYKDGSGTFNVILNNLRKCRKEYEGKIALRVNVDKSNVDAIKEIVNMVQSEGLSELVRVYLGRVIDTENGNNETCFNTCEFAEKNLAFMLNGNDEYTFYRSNYPRPLGNVCGADYNLSYVIDSTGDIYKCHMAIGDKNKCIGHVSAPTELLYNGLVSQYLLFDPTDDEICRHCKYLPLCLGGCTDKRMRGHKDCTEKKYYLKSYIDNIPRMKGES